MLRGVLREQLCLTQDEPWPQRIGDVGLGPKPLWLRLFVALHQPRAAKVTASVAVVGKMPSIPRAVGI